MLLYVFPLLSDVPVALTAIGRTGWTTAAQTRWALMETCHFRLLNTDGVWIRLAAVCWKNPFYIMPCSLKYCARARHFSCFRPRTRCVTSATLHTSIPSPPQLSPKQHPGAKRPPPAETHTPRPTLPPASPLKVKQKQGHGACCVWAQGFFSASDGCSVLGDVNFSLLLLNFFLFAKHARDTLNSLRMHKYVLELST